MTSPLNPVVVEPSSPTSPRPQSQAWYRPIFSPEHGVYVMLVVAFLIGVAAAQAWTWTTTLALICAFCGFQAEHPWMLQIKQRKSLKLRFWIWGSLYTAIAGTIALYLYWLQSHHFTAINSPGAIALLAIYGGAVFAFGVDAFSVFHREQKSVLNELITFFAVCLVTPLVHVVTTESFSVAILGLWILNSLFFSSTIFTVKFRKDKSHSVQPSLFYHAIALLVVIGLWWCGWLSPLTAIAFTAALVKFSLILWQRQWYCTTPIQGVATLETGFALAFLAIVVLSILPAHLSVGI